MSKNDLARAFNTLVTYNDIEVYVETLDDFFECWLTHERTDSDSSNERATRYYAYKNLKDFLIKSATSSQTPHK